MKNTQDITGQKFGKLEAVRMAGKNKYSQEMWECLCECGEKITTLRSSLINGKTKSCGCLRSTNLIGKKFGRLTVLERIDGQKYQGQIIWKCICDCGKYKNVPTNLLKSGKTSSCGCLQKESRDYYNSLKFIDYSGKRFGRLTVIKPAKERRHGTLYWKCKCDCGNSIEVPVAFLVKGYTTSCGCYAKEVSKKTLDKELDYVDGTIIQLINPERKVNRNNTSGVKGVSLSKGKYRASITFKKKVYYLGEYSNLADAAMARKIAEDKLYGEFLEWYYETYPDKKK